MLSALTLSVYSGPGHMVDVIDFICGMYVCIHIHIWLSGKYVAYMAYFSGTFVGIKCEAVVKVAEGGVLV